ncbi:hypothetical protein KCU96_g59, partial [Aureobasidium melanogenum]
MLGLTGFWRDRARLRCLWQGEMYFVSQANKRLVVGVWYFIFPFPNPPVPPEASPLACTAQTSQTPTQDNPTTPTPVRVGVAGLSEAEPQATDAVRRDCNFLAVARLTSALRVDPLLQQRAASDEKRACTRHWHRGSIAHDSCTMLTMLENVKINGVESHDSVHLHQLILA